MATLSRTTVLNSLIKHETLTIQDIRLPKNLGLVPDNIHLNFLLNELMEKGQIETLNGVEPLTYTITTKGIEEGERLQDQKIK